MMVKCVLLLAPLLSTAIEVQSRVDCQTRLQQCETKNSHVRRKVCGTDNKTYPNRCALIKVQCSQNSPLSVKHRGRCKEKQPCWMDQGRRTTSLKVAAKRRNTNLSLTLKSSLSTTSKDYIPECLADGTYAPIQCHKPAAYCWCVTPAGKIVPGTSVQNRKPDCPKRGKKKLDNNDPSNDEKIKDCDNVDKIIFSNNLVRIFKTEYNRDIYTRQNDEKLRTKLSADNRAVRWKFKTLDKDGDNTLKKDEYKDLKALVRKVVTPRKCSRVFVNLCDTNHDIIISELEWNSCLTVNYSNENNVAGTRLPVIEDTPLKTDTELSEETEVSSQPDDNSGIMESGIVSLSNHPTQLSEEDENKETEANDCLSDRKAVLDELKIGNQEMYVPECTSDGRYKRVQCYKSTGYCWCVLEDSGKPIPGTSVKDSNPKCEAMRTTPRPMEGCSESRKLLFTKELMEFFRNNVSEIVKNGAINAKNQAVETYEMLASNAFNNLDANKNKVLDRNEWKAFRQMIVKNKNKILRRCGKRLPRYCDVIRDNKITLTEWLNCLSIQNLSSFHTSEFGANLRRRGPNPLESYLKEDD